MITPDSNGRENPALSFCSSSLNCSYNPSLYYVHVSPVLGSSEPDTVLQMHFSSAEARSSSTSLDRLLRSWMLLALSAARTAESRSTRLPVGTPRFFLTNLLPSQLASRLSGSPGLRHFRRKTAALCSYGNILGNSGAK